MLALAIVIERIAFGRGVRAGFAALGFGRPTIGSIAAAFGTVTSFGAITCIRAITACAVTAPRPISACSVGSAAIANPITRAGTVLSGVEHLLAVAAADIHPICGARPFGVHRRTRLAGTSKAERHPCTSRCLKTCCTSWQQQSGCYALAS